MPSQNVRVERKFNLKDMPAREKKTHSLANKRRNRHHFLSEQRNLLKLQGDPFKNVHADYVIRSSIHLKI
jgi:hypothetical protein